MCTPVQQEGGVRRESESDGGWGRDRRFPFSVCYADICITFVVVDRRLHSLRAGNPLFKTAKEEYQQQQHGEAHGLNPENGFFSTNEELYRM